MKKYAFLMAAAVLTQAITPALAGPFKDATMLGWQRKSSSAAVAYVSMPFHAGKNSRAQPRAGLMITAPQGYRVGYHLAYTAAPGIIDFGITGRNFRSPWVTTINVNNAVAWASAPEELPKNTKHLFESGASWAVVGAVTVGIVAGVLSLSNRDQEVTTPSE
jgi:hypothetical protein